MSVTLLIIILFSSVALYYQNEALELTASHDIDMVQDKFNSLKEHDTRMLASALEVVVQDQEFKDIYLEKNRTKLFEYGQPLFQNLKDKYTITHFYFIQPDGHCFVRLHNKEIYGDLITRFTFWNANETKEFSSGLELGKTAFALRAVMPYYNSSELIGYVELGEEIGHFFEIMKGETNNEFAIIVEKQYLDQEKWESVRQVAGLRNNWDDLQDHVIIYETVEEDSETIEPYRSYFVSENANLIKNGEFITQIIEHKGQTFVFGGFTLIDAGNREVGAIFSLMDITEHAIIHQETNTIIFFVAIVLFIVAFGISILISRSLSKPIIKLKDVAGEIGGGKLDTKIGIDSKDEVGELATAFSQMTENLKKSRDEIEKYSQTLEERTRELETKIDELQKYKKVIVGRELKMIELKNRIKELEEGVKK